MAHERGPRTMHRMTAIAQPTDPAAMPAPLIESAAPHPAVATEQHLDVAASAGELWDALWRADLLSGRLGRWLVGAAAVPQRLAARHRGTPAPARGAATIGVLAEGDAGWIPLPGRPGHEIVFGLLWRPPVGGTVVAPDEFEEFSAPGFAKVLWGFEVLRLGARRSHLVCRTRTTPLDDLARRQFAAVWPFIGPFAALARRDMMAAVRRAAEE